MLPTLSRPTPYGYRASRPPPRSSLTAREHTHTQHNPDPQIAVNKKYICYGLKAGQIRVINLFTAGRALMRGHEAPLCDLKFFGEDVDLLGTPRLTLP